MRKYEYENVYLENVTCQSFDELAFMVSSSIIGGYDKLQTYYVITSTNDYLECLIFDNDCDCKDVDDQVAIDTMRRSRRLLLFENIEFLQEYYSP